ncbi:MAG: hypothetical protein ACJ70M_07665 [Nitrososphaera sp.]
MLSIIGGAIILAPTATLSPVFSTVSTSVDQGQLSQSSPTQDISNLASSATQDVSNLFKGIEQFLAPSGYAQAREDPSYAIDIPFSERGYSPFEPFGISIPTNMGVIWFNDDDS